MEPELGAYTKGEWQKSDPEGHMIHRRVVSSLHGDQEHW